MQSTRTPRQTPTRTRTGLSAETVRAVRAKGPAGSPVSPTVRPLVYLATDYPGGETAREAVETCLRDGLPGDILNRVRSVTLHLA